MRAGWRGPRGGPQASDTPYTRAPTLAARACSLRVRGRAVRRRRPARRPQGPGDRDGNGCLTPPTPCPSARGSRPRFVSLGAGVQSSDDAADVQCRRSARAAAGSRVVRGHWLGAGQRLRPARLSRGCGGASRSTGLLPARVCASSCSITQPAASGSPACRCTSSTAAAAKAGCADSAHGSSSSSRCGRGCASATWPRASGRSAARDHDRRNRAREAQPGAGGQRSTGRCSTPA